MLLLLENFDDVEAIRYITNVYLNDVSTLSSLFVSGAGKGGSNAMALTGDVYFNVKSSTRLVVGFYVRSYRTGYFKAFYRKPTEDYFHEAFRLTFTYSTGGKVVVSFYNPNQTSIENYPTITNATAYQDTETGFSLIEIMLDLEDAEAHLGKIKVAIDGVEYADISNAVTAPINLFTDGLNSPVANYSAFTISGFGNVDSVYACNEDKGFHNSFFGPYDITNLLPIDDGSYSNWKRQEYDEDVDDLDTRANAEFVSKSPFDPEDAEYMSVNASQTLVKDLYLFAASSIRSDLEVFAVEHKFWFKGMSEEQLQEVSAITPIGQASGQAVSFANDFTAIAIAYYYKQVGVIYDVVPTTSAEWDWENLSLAQFGYCFFETELISVLDICTITLTSPVVGTYADLIDGDEETYARTSKIAISLSEPTPIRELTFLVNNSSAIGTGTCVDSGGRSYTFTKEYDSDTGVLTAKLAMDYVEAEIVTINFTCNSTYFIYELDVFTWERVGV